jgi:DNA-directed RNA polymerase subunit K/omega
MNDDELNDSDEEYETDDNLSQQEQEQEEDEKEINRDPENDDDTNTDDEKIDTDDNNYLQKFETNIRSSIIADYHPELKTHSFEEIIGKTDLKRDKNGQIDDPLHRTQSFFTRYEVARIVGERAKQLSAGAEPLIEIEDEIIDEYTIAMKEFYAKKIPFIIERPLPDGTMEYWKASDLEILL